MIIEEEDIIRKVRLWDLWSEACAKEAPLVFDTSADRPEDVVKIITEYLEK